MFFSSSIRKSMAVSLFASAALLAPVACAQVPGPPAAAPIAHPNSIQPETTLSLQANGEMMVAPDVAFISAGVESEAETASEAMAKNRAAMTAVFETLSEAGIPERDIQTSNLSLNPVYTYVENDNGRGGRNVLSGYRVSNQLTIKVSDLDALGTVLDNLVEAGGNTFHGLRFALEDARGARNEARRIAIQNAMEQAEVYAYASGYSVGRIVTLSEHGGGLSPQPMMETIMARSASADMSTPVAGGEVGYQISISVTFELLR